jgi:phosphoribosylglycinamide formyltransferase-1
MKIMKIGIIGNSGGSYFAEAFQILQRSNLKKIQYVAVTDRQCGFESFCQLNEIMFQRIKNPDNRKFSIQAKEYFDLCGGLDFIILFFSRLVTKELFHHYPTFNIHPALLPAFRGNHAVEQAQNAGVRFLGTTLHLIDEGIDTGPILAQACAPIRRSDPTERLQTISFVQKVYLLLLLVETYARESFRIKNKNSAIKMLANLPYNDHYNPCLRDSFLIKEIAELTKRQIG